MIQKNSEKTEKKAPQKIEKIKRQKPWPPFREERKPAPEKDKK